MPGIFAVAFVALLLVQCSCNVIKSYFDSKTNDFFNFIFAPVLAFEVSYVLLPKAVEN